ncbi:MAG: hypothetical protein DI617_01420 [Streptococcus pyogenes]|nr:MAG: hypothetical protein DI617_01420 [Streptococcus pyogenes]
MLTLSKQCIKKSALLIVAFVGLGTYGQAAQANTQWEDYKAQMVNSYYDSDYQNIDKSVRYSKDIRTDNQGKKVIHWTVNFNPAQENWNFLKCVMFLPKEAKPTSIKMGVWFQEYKNDAWRGTYYKDAVKEYKTQDLLNGVQYTPVMETDAYAISYQTQRSSFENLWSTTIQQTQEGDSLSNFNAIKDQGRFDLAFVQYSKYTIADNHILRWEFDTPLDYGLDAENTPFIVGVIGDGVKYPRFLGEMERKKVKIELKDTAHYQFKSNSDNFVWMKRWGGITTQVKEQILNKVQVANGYVPLDLFSIQEKGTNDPVIVMPEAVSSDTHNGQTLPETEPSLKDKIDRYYPQGYWNDSGYRHGHGRGHGYGYRHR